MFLETRILANAKNMDSSAILRVDIEVEIGTISWAFWLTRSIDRSLFLWLQDETLCRCPSHFGSSTI